MMVGVSAIVAAISLFMYVDFPRRMEAQAMDAVTDKALSLARMSAYSLAAAAYFEDENDVDEVLQGLSADPEVYYVMVLDPAGRVIASVAQERAEEDAFEETTEPSLSPDGRVLRVQAPIEYLKSHVGRVYVGVALDRIQAAVAKSRRQGAGLALLVFVLALFGVVVIGMVIERLERRNQGLSARFATLFDSADLGLATIDGDGVIREHNKALRDIAGAEQLSGRRLTSLLDPVDATQVGDWIETLRRGERESINGEIRPGPPAATDGRWHLTLSGVRDPSDDIDFVMAIVEDVSDRRQLEQQLLQAQKMEAVGRLAGGVAHDFNNLLTTINGTASVALMELDDHAAIETDLREILAAGERAASLTHQLLAFSRRQMVQQKVVELNAVIAETATMLRRLIGEDVRLHLELSHTVPPVLADPGQLGQVLVNLVVNARDAMPGGGQLWIETGALELDIGLSLRFGAQRTGRHAMLRVRDTGEGMDQTTLSMIFEPFFTTKPVGKGTGLGLPTVYGIVKQSSGGILVESTPGTGTTFTIVLPEHVGREAVEAAPMPEEGLMPGSGTILLVEDEDGVRRLVSRVLRRAGYHVLEADDPRAAIQMASGYEGRLDALVTDVVMPGMGGTELARTLVSMFPQLKVLFMSGYTRSEVLPAEQLGGDSAFLPKPMTPADLTRTLAELIGRRPVRA
jgi:PAS domain S-box-containing protein